MTTISLIAMTLALTATQDSSAAPVRPVPEVDLARYAGRWYEVARLPNRFQAKCARETTADYELLADGQIRVVNACRRGDGGLMRAEGRARLARRGGPTSELKVRFAPAFLSFLPMVWGDYWILDLTADYGAALVGSPSRAYLWILSRTPELDDASYQRMVAAAAAQGFDVARLVRSPGVAGGAASPPVARR
jgi:apolipoprotein D and lipocalin family protein